MCCKKSSALITTSNPLELSSHVYSYGVKQDFLGPVIGRTTKKGVKMTVFRLGDSNFVEFELIFWLAKS